MKKAKSQNCDSRVLPVGENEAARPRLFLGMLIFRPALLTILVFFQSALAPAQASPEVVEMVAVGDILLTRGVEKQIVQFGTGYPFENVKSILADADLAFGNLENPLSNKCEKAEKEYSFRAAPGSAKILRDAGLDILSLANNHSLDCGKIGLFETIESLRREKLRWLGAAETAGAAAESEVFVEIRGVKIAFLGFTAILPGKPAGNPPDINTATAEKVAREVAAARRRADIIIVSLHWGTEYDSRPDAGQIELANAALKAGGDVVLGHHPHVLQGFRLTGDGAGKRSSLVAFSLGNFVFDSPVRVIKKTAESAILRVRFDKKGLVSAAVVPVSIENYRPVVAVGEKRQLILNRLNRLSGQWNTALDEGQIVMKSYADNVY